MIFKYKKWSHIHNFDRYKISEQGKVFDMKLNRIISQHISSDGYFCITLRNNEGRRKTFKIHRLIGVAFIPNPLNKPEINHKDGLKCNNFVENLEWVSHSENIKHAWDFGLIKRTKERSLKLSLAHKGQKVGKDNRRSMRIKCITTNEVFYCQREGAKKYNAQQSQISRAIHSSTRTAGKHPITKEPLKWGIYQ